MFDSSSTKTDLIILAGGFGTRIQSISRGVPKALLPVGDGVFIDKILSKLDKLNIGQIYLSLHYKSELFGEYLKKSSQSNRIAPIIEPEPLGTGGAIKYIINQFAISDPIFVINGDTLSNINFENMRIAFHQSDYDAMIGVSFVENNDRYGTVEFDHDRLTQFTEKNGSHSSGWINNGHYIINAQLFNNMETKFSIEHDVFIKAASEGRLGVFPVEDDEFIDIGIPSDYERLSAKQ